MQQICEQTEYRDKVRIEFTSSELCCLLALTINKFLSDLKEEDKRLPIEPVLFGALADLLIQAIRSLSAHGLEKEKVTALALRVIHERIDAMTFSDKVEHLNSEVN